MEWNRPIPGTAVPHEVPWGAWRGVEEEASDTMESCPLEDLFLWNIPLKYWESGSSPIPQYVSMQTIPTLATWSGQPVDMEHAGATSECLAHLEDARDEATFSSFHWTPVQSLQMWQGESLEHLIHSDGCHTGPACRVQVPRHQGMSFGVSPCG